MSVFPGCLPHLRWHQAVLGGTRAAAAWLSASLLQLVCFLVAFLTCGGKKNCFWFAIGSRVAGAGAACCSRLRVLVCGWLGTGAAEHF